MVTTQIRIAERFGKFVVESLDSNDVWVVAEPGASTFSSLTESQECVDRWLDCMDNAEQVETVVIA